MLANALALLLAGSALLTSAAPLPRDLLEAKDVGVLTCTTHFAGYLQYNLNGLYANISFTGPKTDGLPILHTTRANGDEVPGHDFTFKTCVSNKAESFMGPAPAGSSGPGHFELTSTPGKCITRRAIAGKKHSNFVLEDCSLSDDSSQLLQSFALSEKGYAEFLGFRSGEKQDWRLTVSSQEYNEILAEHVDTNTIVGNIDLYFPSYYVTSGTEGRRDLEAREVGVLTCTEVFTGPLQYNLDADYGYLSFTGPKNEDGLPILHTTRANGDKVPSHDFTFKKCTSNQGDSFIGPALGAEVGRGHIELTSSPGHCITRSSVAGKKHSQFVLAPCSLSDDSGQLLQSFDLGPKGYGEFLGHQGDDRPNWQVSLSSKEYKDVLAKIVDTDNIVGNLYFYFPTYVASTKEARDVEARDVEVKDVEARDVGVLTCTTLYTGVLEYFAKGVDPLFGNLSFTGPKTESGLPILHAFRANGKNVPAHEFTFKSCKSNKAESFIGSPTGDEVAIGHVELTSSPGKCITRHSVAGKVHFNFVLEECSLSDDSSQLLQSFDLGSDGYVAYLGHQQDAGPAWELSLSSQEYREVLAKDIGSGYTTASVLFKFPSYGTA